MISHAHFQNSKIYSGLRIDKYLKVIGIIPSRTYSKRACDKGYVRVDGKPVKASHNVREGEIIEIDLPDRYIKLKVTGVPQKKNVKKSEREEYYELIQYVRKNII